ncbi:MAG: amidohydrolase family protein [Acidobacteria bacterium]|nr:amidohydrolase family protein [Acidobacteriota bacterium]
MRRSIVLTVLFTFSFLVSLSLGQQTADTILYNGKVLTVNEKFTIAEAVAIKDGKFLAVGKSDEILQLAGPNTLKIDLKGQTVAPGQVHTHTHVHARAEDEYGGHIGPQKLRTFPINFRLVKTKDDVVKQMRDIMSTFKFKPNEWIFFAVTSQNAEQIELVWENLTRYDLDKATPDNPVVFSIGVPANSGYMTNSKGIEILWQKYGDFIEKYGRYYVGADGKPNGHLEPPAGRLAWPLVPGPSPEDGAEIYRMALDEFPAEGVTTLSTRLPDYAIEIYKALEKKGQLPVRFGYGIQDVFDTPDAAPLKNIKIGSGSDMLWVTSVSSGMVDGATYGFCTDLKRNDTAVNDPTAFGVLGWDSKNPMAKMYNRGWCFLDIEFKGGRDGSGAPIKGNYFNDWFQLVAQNGLRSANTHVQGDASHRMFLTMLEKIDAAKPGSVKGWGMDHCTMINPKDIPRAAKLGIQFSCGPGGRGNANLAQVFNEEVASTYNSPIKSLLDAGVNVGLEGEQTYRWQTIEMIITRKDNQGKVWGPHERLDRATALRVSTVGGAKYVLKDKHIGSIEPGKFADLVILSHDYMTIPEDQISDIYPLVTIMGGKVTYVHPKYAEENNFKPAGATIMTREQLQARRKHIIDGSIWGRS